MGLKIAQFTFTNFQGMNIPVLLTWGGIDINWKGRSNIKFNAYASEIDSQRDVAFNIFLMPVSQEDVAGMLTEEGLVGLVVSDQSWQLASETAFIEDWSLVENGNRVMVKKSLADLNAEIIDVGISALKGETK